ncbi:LysR family transcriptional regulator [Limnoraphis robusta]|uniref:LysR family transcriptional regulator n=1 Tax=Limnoraphis robusta CCNP1315 TaxID=3110306 RepID=A0ABU5U2K2_9CYAN|nr:LysR family transcriptional regulator [Limnoraphis robusta]MEA5501042.1 LysR family transcriptional regulator [Limnoraphis robusta BA-68 BA1]MEA5521121.1 LysR family transcriptional regulator [Limnoraphis robusta CCNP1315]
MTLEEFRIFLAVAEHLHLTQAAEELYITQTTVSAAIKTLQTECVANCLEREQETRRMRENSLIGWGENWIYNSIKINKKTIKISFINQFLLKIQSRD